MTCLLASPWEVVEHVPIVTLALALCLARARWSLGTGKVVVLFPPQSCPVLSFLLLGTYVCARKGVIEYPELKG